MASDKRRCILFAFSTKNAIEMIYRGDHAMIHTIPAEIDISDSAKQANLTDSENLNNLKTRNCSNQNSSRRGACCIKSSNKSKPESFTDK